MLNCSMINILNSDDVFFALKFVLHLELYEEYLRSGFAERNMIMLNLTDFILWL